MCLLGGSGHRRWMPVERLRPPVSGTRSDPSLLVPKFSLLVPKLSLLVPKLSPSSHLPAVPPFVYLLAGLPANHGRCAAGEARCALLRLL